MHLRPRAIVALVALPAALLTLVVSLLPYVHFAYRSRGLHIAVEAGAGVIAFIAAYLVFGRYRRSASRNDLALVLALAVLALVNVCFAAVPIAIAEGRPSSFVTWAPVAGGGLGAALFAFAALAPEARLRRPGGAALVAGLEALVVLGGIAGLVSVLSLPHGIDPGLSPEASGRPRIVGEPAMLAWQILLFLLFATAAVGFTRRAEHGRDPFFSWLAAGSVLAAFARLNYFLFPSIYSDWVYTGDLLRLGFYLVLLLGAAHEINAYWRRHAEAATLEARRRLARELHDGMAQELAYLVMQSRSLLEAGAAPRGVEHLHVAATRALDEARRAMAALTHPLDDPLAKVVGQLAEDVAARCGVGLELRIAGDVEVSPRSREELLRIVRDGVTNAAMHGRATVVRIELENGDGLRLRIADDGEGFDPEAAPPNGMGGFGLTSMRERAESLGGRLLVRSRPGLGTEIEVHVP
jgi:signal transduction histidine kinase